jgi:hypothetical protein
MNNRKVLFLLASFLLPLLLVLPTYTQETISASERASVHFEEIVVQAAPLEVKSVTGEVRQFISSSEVSRIQPIPGNLVSFYSPAPRAIFL